RTPMNAIVGFTELAKHHLEEPEVLRDYIGKVEEAGRHMTTLLDNLLEMSDIDYGRLQLRTEASDLRAELEETVSAFRPQAEKKRLALETDFVLPSQPVMLDTAHFRRILGNLIDNAVRFTPSGGRVAVSARQRKIAASGYARYEFVVSDNGVGMDEEFLGRIFKPFERDESFTDASYPGAGLGLSIARSLLHVMGGSVTVESQKGEGTSFTVNLPLKLVEQAAPLPEEKRVDSVSVKAEGERRILLVEDIDVNRIMAEIMLKEAGFLVESVPDGCDAVEAVRNHEPWYYDAILMDIQMPIMNGFEATRAIRALGRDDAHLMPIIALSANARENDRQMSRECGMDDHVAKPFDLARLITTLNEHIAAGDAKR
ncbi:MAG: response regulator, partial [Schwartzia sp.]|nr:response regulator [Schwartzia sp. (in: firmicutes)]